MKYILLFLIVTANFLSAQDRPLAPKRNDTLIAAKKQRNPKKQKPADVSEITIKDYKIISFQRDTTFLDTTLTIRKEYKYNYLRKDDFELMPFANIGQGYNKLGVSLERKNLYPRLGARARSQNYKMMEDIDYYNVATPMTDLLFKTTLEEGQLLDALLTFNTSKRLNFSLAYKGFRSLGKYQYDQAESGDFKATSNYVTKNGRYSVRVHIAAQDATNEENGGLTNKEDQFESNDPDFIERVKLDVRFNTANANNKLLSKRYFFDHKYKLIKKQKDSSRLEKTSLAIGHQFNYETIYSQFLHSAEDAYYGNALLTSINDRARLMTMYNQVNADFYNATLGNLQANLSLYNYNYFFNSVFSSENQNLDHQLKGEEVALGAAYEKQIGGFFVRANAKYKLAGELTGNIIDASASYRLNKKNKLGVAFHSSARMPNFNFLLYQSDYENYNWQHTDDFEKENISSLAFVFESQTWGDVKVKYTSIDNYSYFAYDPSKTLVEGAENAFIRPFQESSALQYLKVKYNKEFRVGKFALNNTVMYQNVSQANNVLNLPELVTRNTLYFSDNVFKKAMYLQTGFTFKYFSKYSMDAYNAVLGEFYIQNEEQLGGYPLIDFFINAKVQQTRIFLKAEHFNAAFGDRNYYSAPNYPYRDFVIRFGLVWNFFS